MLLTGWRPFYEPSPKPLDEKNLQLSSSAPFNFRLQSTDAPLYSVHMFCIMYNVHHYSFHSKTASANGTTARYFKLLLMQFLSRVNSTFCCWNCTDCYEVSQSIYSNLSIYECSRSIDFTFSPVEALYCTLHTRTYLLYTRSSCESLNKSQLLRSESCCDLEFALSLPRKGINEHSIDNCLFLSTEKESCSTVDTVQYCILNTVCV